MSCFLDILRCILCCEDEERPLTRNNLSHYEYNRIPDNGSFSRTISPTTDGFSGKQFNFGQTTSTSRTIQHKSYPNSSYVSTGLSRTSYDNLISSKPPEVVKPSDSATLSGLNKKNSAAISQNSPCRLPASLSLPEITSTSSISSKPTLSSTSQKLGECTAKGKVCPLTPSSVKAFQQDATYQKNILVKGNTSDVLKLDASQRILNKSHESYDQKRGDLLPSTKSASLKSSPLITKPVLFSILEKSSNVSQKLKDLPSTVAPNCTFQTEVTKKGTNKTIDKKPPQGESSAKLSTLSIKPTLSPAPSSPASNQGKSSYSWVEKGATPTYVCPEDIKSLIEKDIVPGVLKKPLSMSTYKEFFQALLYAEDIYLEKWEGFEMKNVTLQLHKAAICFPRLEKGVKKVDKTFIAFEVDKIPEKRPYLLSRDFVTVQPLRNNIKTFQGIIYRVIRSNLVLAEFEEDFHRQHDLSGVYNVKFSFNRVCLKRAHQAILAVSDNLLRNLLFPNLVTGNRLHSPEPYGDHRVGRKEECALQQILSLQGSPPYLVEGPLSICKNKNNQLSETGVLVVDTIMKIYQTFPSKRILLCAPTNNTCDVFMRALKKRIPESDMFRANAAFRELDGVPEDILPSCLYKEEQECFSCPSRTELLQFKVILSTFMSSFRLHNEGIAAGHFSHIFLVDASSAIEPEILVPLAHLTNERTAVVITGALGNRSRWVRSNIARRNGLNVSYFERQRESRLYQDLDPNVITVLEGADQKSDHSYGFLSFY